MDMHGESGSSVAQPSAMGEAGQVVDRPDGYEPPIMKTVQKKKKIIFYSFYLFGWFFKFENKS